MARPAYTQDHAKGYMVRHRRNVSRSFSPQHMYNEHLCNNVFPGWKNPPRHRLLFTQPSSRGLSSVPRAPASHTAPQNTKRVPGLPSGEQEAIFRAPSAQPGRLRKWGLGDLSHLGPHQRWVMVARSPRLSGTRQCLSFSQR